MAAGIRHQDIQKMVSALGKAEIVNLDASLRSIIEPVAASLKPDLGSEVALHVLCCNEYFLVTGLTGIPIGGIEQQAGAVRESLQA
jgi:hypothetical protein